MADQATTQAQTNPKVTAVVGRYIKLGPKGAWEAKCLQEGTLRLGFYEVPHDLAQAGDEMAIRQIYADKDPKTATSYARQILAFYDPSPDTIWVTFADDCLWWCKAQPDVTFLGSDKIAHPDGSRLRPTTDGWHNKSLGGKLLRKTDLRGDLVAVAGFMGTICNLKPDLLDYLLRRTNDEELPAIATAQQAKETLLSSLRAVIAMLRWQDFELLVGLIFAQSGWQRVSVVGDTMKTTDIELVLPVTGERAMVQVKSRTTQAQLDNYIAAFDRWNSQRLFYVYHTAKGPLSVSDPNDRVSLIGPGQLSQLVLKAGLTDWVMDKAG